MKKYLSRKFVITVLTAIVGVATALSGLGGKYGVVCGLIGTFVSTIVYVITEGKIDKADVEKAVETAKQIEEVITKD
jgi:hypothetical protein